MDNMDNKAGSTTPEISGGDRFVIKHLLPYLKDISTVLCVIMIVFLFCFRIAVVDGSSMNDTLLHGDYLLQMSTVIAGEPKQGDIVVINKESYGEPIIKRVIATEGQQVQIDNTTGVVTVDGTPVVPFRYTVVRDGSDVYTCTVEPGHIFVLGDNRGVSLDSRSSVIGQIDCREVMGKAVFRFWGNDKLSRFGVLS